LRFDAATTYSGIGHTGIAGIAFGTFTGNRWLVLSGLIGTKAGCFVIEASAKIYALWERDNVYTDSTARCKLNATSRSAVPLAAR